jgi:hypothetical protein
MADGHGRAATLLALLLGAGTLRAETGALRFGSEVAVVNVHANVTRDGDTACEGLTAADFRIAEGGAPQEVAFFAHEEVPVTYTLLVDVSGSMQKRARLVFEALETFVATMRPEDRASIVLFGSTARVLQEETGPRRCALVVFSDGKDETSRRGFQREVLTRSATFPRPVPPPAPGIPCA